MAKYQCKTQSAIPTDEGATTATAKSAGGRLGNSAIKKFSEVSAVNLTDAKKASVTNSNATNNNYFMKIPKC